MAIYMEGKQAFLMPWKPAQFMICTPQSFQLMEASPQHYLDAMLLTRQKECSCDARIWVITSLVFLCQVKHAFRTWGNFSKPPCFCIFVYEMLEAQLIHDTGKYMFTAKWEKGSETSYNNCLVCTVDFLGIFTWKDLVVFESYVDKLILYF